MKFLCLAHISRKTYIFPKYFKNIKESKDFKSYIIAYKMEIRDKKKWGIENGLIRLRIHEEVLWTPLV